MRSVPDVVVDADPIQGMELCEADAGGCPTGQLYGGTSIATPEWAAFAADLNIMFGTDLGNLNRKLYALKGTKAFHGAASMGSDFAHVGLGSPDLLRLKLALGGGALGPVNVTQSIVGVATRNSDGTAAADGQDQATVQAILADARGFPVSGKTVSLTATSGSLVITPGSLTTGTDGTAVFSLTDLVSENVAVTARDTTDGVTLTQKPVVQFVVPPAVGGGLVRRSPYRRREWNFKRDNPRDPQGLAGAWHSRQDSDPCPRLRPIRDQRTECHRQYWSDSIHCH
jgi:hypothetical protein